MAVGLAVGQEASGGKGSGGGQSNGHPFVPDPAEAKWRAQDRRYGNEILLIVLGGVVVALSLCRVAVCSVRYIRTLACLNESKQQYFQRPHPMWARIKQHLLYAPLFRSRHSRQFRLFSMNLGILPTRVQSLFLVGVIGMNVLYCVYGVPWHGAQQEMLGHLRNRTGILSLVNMIPLVLLAGRNNPLIVALNIPFDTFNLVHRFLGRIATVEAVVHSIAHIIKMVDGGTFHYSSPSLSVLTPSIGGWKVAVKVIQESQMITIGFIVSASGHLLDSKFVTVAECRGNGCDCVSGQLNFTTGLLRGLLAFTYSLGHSLPCYTTETFAWAPGTAISHCCHRDLGF